MTTDDDSRDDADDNNIDDDDDDDSSSSSSSISSKKNIVPELSIFNRQVYSPSLEIDDDEEDKDGRDEIGEVR